MSMEKVRLENVSKRYGSLLAVDSLTLKLEAGEIFGFLGPNGAGKTTTIKMIAGLLKPTSGKVYISGLDVLSSPKAAKAKLGYVPDSPFLYNRLTGREFLYLVAGLYGLDGDRLEKKLEWLFDMFGIGDWVDTYAGEYSHGMKQKIVLSSAIIQDPELLLIDEPMVGLDPESQRVVKDFCRLFAQMSGTSTGGGTVFMSTHTLSVAEEVCTHIGIIHKGKLLLLTTPEELKREATKRGLTLEGYFLELTGGGRKVHIP